MHIIKGGSCAVPAVNPGQPRSNSPLSQPNQGNPMPAPRSTPTSASQRRSNQRVRRTNAQLLIDKLTELSGDDRPLVSNPTLRGALKWDVQRYARTKAQLVAEGKVIVGRGPGGSVALAGDPDGQTLKVFVSYSHADEKLKDAVLRHLKPLERMGLISEWHDRKLLAGDRWAEEISRGIEDADIVLLLISIDFINSKYCYDVELDRALERHAEGSCRVIPIILRGCLWQHTPFAKLQALPRDGKPAVSWPDLDEALASVADGLRATAAELLAGR